MQKFFINKIKNNVVSFSKEDEHKLINVLRVSNGYQLIAIDKNKKYQCHINSINPLRAIVDNEVIDDTANKFELNVFQASIKPNHLEIALSKATELNVDNFYIWNSKYSQMNIKHNLERYQKIIKESCEQSNRVKLMNIKIIDHDELITLLKNNDLNIIAHLEKNSNNDLDHKLSNDFKKIGIVIGPEGGFNEFDMALLNINNPLVIKLTKTILRSETAMIYLCSVVSYFMLRKTER